jgi:hypothetical protein
MIEFIESQLGKPWEKGAAGPDAYDCWGWAEVLQRVAFGREIGTIAEPPEDKRALIEFVKAHAARKNWRQVETPVHGGLVELAHNSRPFHIGVYLDIDGGGISHATAGVGVTFDTILALRAAGWRRFVFHEWSGDCG